MLRLRQGGRLRWRALCLLVLLGLFAAGASAQGGQKGVEDIRLQMDRGQGLFLAGQFEQAAQIFEEGYQTYPYSAFLFNAGVCHQRVGNAEKALGLFRLYLEKDPTAPDAAQVQERIVQLEEALRQARLEAGWVEPVEGEEQETEAPPAVQTPIQVSDATNAKMKSLVVVETEPPGAPLQIFQRVDPRAAAFQEEGENPGWRLIAERTSPADFTLDVGKYHIVVEKFREFNRSETDIDVSPGHVHQFKANLSQGAFMAFLRVNSNVPGAYLYVDDDGRKKVAWGRAPYGQLVPPGSHVIQVEAPGYEPAKAVVELEAGEQKELDVQLVRLGYGLMRIDANAPEISVTVNKEQVGTWKRGEVALDVRLPAGKHEVFVRAPGHKDLRATVDVPRGQVLPVRAQMVESYPRGTAWAQAVLAAGFLGASTYFALESNRLEEELVEQRQLGYLSNSDSRLDQGYWYSIGADAGFVVGGVFAVLSAYNFIRDPYPDSQLRRGKRVEFEDKLAAPRPAASSAAAQKGTQP